MLRLRRLQYSHVGVAAGHLTDSCSWQIVVEFRSVTEFSPDFKHCVGADCPDMRSFLLFVFEKISFKSIATSEESDVRDADCLRGC